MDPQLRPVMAREMEVYAGFMEHTDHHVGRLIDALEDLEVLDDTLIFVIIGDNGASAEGGLQGTFNELIHLNGIDAETPEFLMQRIGKFGGPEAYNHYAVGWAHAMDTPYQWTKQVASHWGGTRNGTIVHWPNGIKAKGRDPQPVLSRDRRGPDDPGSGRHSRADGRQQRPAEPARGDEHALQLRGRQGAGAARDAVLRDVLQPRHLPQGLERGDPPFDAVRRRSRSPPSTTTSGSSTTEARTGRRRAISRRRCRRSFTSCSGCG